MRSSDWSADVCSSDLSGPTAPAAQTLPFSRVREKVPKADEGASEASWLGEIKITLRCARAPHPALRATFSREREKGWGASRRDGALDHRPHGDEPVAPPRRTPRHAVTGPGLRGPRDAHRHSRGLTRRDDAQLPAPPPPTARRGARTEHG